MIHHFMTCSTASTQASNKDVGGRWLGGEIGASALVHEAFLGQTHAEASGFPCSVSSAFHGGGLLGDVPISPKKFSASLMGEMSI